MRLEIVTKRRWWGTRWWIRLVGGNEETVMHSETYATHQKAQQAATEVAANGRTGLPVREVAE